MSATPTDDGTKTTTDVVPDSSAAPVVVGLRCALSGRPFDPATSDVVVTPSGRACERRLLLAKLEENGGVDPFSSSSSDAVAVDLDPSRLVPLDTSSERRVVPPRDAGGFPSLLRALREEHDGLTLELFDARDALERTRRELSQALYQNDAAVRVIARLTQERDRARQQVRDLVGSGGGGNEAATDRPTPTVVEAEEGAPATTTTTTTNNKKRKVDETAATTTEPNVIPPEDVEKMVSTWTKLSKARKKKTPLPPGHATSAMFRERGGLTAVDDDDDGKLDGTDVAHDPDTGWVVTVEKEKGAVCVYDTSSGKNEEVAALAMPNGAGGIDRIAVSYAKSLVLVASSDGTVRAVRVKDGAKILPGTLKLPSSVVGLEIQPTQDYAVAASASGDVVFARLSEEDGLERVCDLASSSDDDATAYTATAVHPDGLILGAGTDDGRIRLWDLRTRTVVTTIAEFGKDGSSPVTSLRFSGNGYHLAAAVDDGRVHVYDVRRLGGKSDKAVAARLRSDVLSSARTVAFDARGRFLAYGGLGGLVVVAVKEWDAPCAELKGVDATASAWGANACAIWTADATTGAVRRWTVPDETKDDAAAMEE